MFCVAGLLGASETTAKGTPVKFSVRISCFCTLISCKQVTMRQNVALIYCNCEDVYQIWFVAHSFIVSPAGVFSVVTQRSSPQTATNIRTRYLSLCCLYASEITNIVSDLTNQSKAECNQHRLTRELASQKPWGLKIIYKDCKVPRTTRWLAKATMGGKNRSSVHCEICEVFTLPE